MTGLNTNTGPEQLPSQRLPSTSRTKRFLKNKKMETSPGEDTTVGQNEIGTLPEGTL